MSSSPSTPVLHYIFDPLCGWCYAAAPLVAATRNLPGLSLKWHAGGMLSGASRRTITPEWRGYVMPHDERIAALTGQPFGDAYFNGLLNQIGATLDSTPPIAAMLAAEALNGRGLDLLARAQTAHYVEGQQISTVAVLRSLAQELGLDPQAFATQYQTALATVPEHIHESREWLQASGGQGFPTFLLEFTDPTSGQRVGQTLDISPWLGNAAGWQAHLQQLLTAAQPRN
ncbi:DsbA family protein [Acidovorax sp. Be4]|uniref:DsbA family protein n=1 Tax=Acidovorax bellezanensis TaxID=2976702 RepID=A0ABT2PRC6_9BURK|nr:DsbA family protein [Acidovorax sp. Be4]MCT9813015.1 DsbA family protein [Acidovorax sp. Be4]